MGNEQEYTYCWSKTNRARKISTQMFWIFMKPRGLLSINDEQTSVFDPWEGSMGKCVREHQHWSWKPTHHYCPSSLEKNLKFVSIEGGIISSSIDLWLLLWKEDVPTYLPILKILQNISDVFFYMLYRSVLALTETFKKDGLLTFTWL